MARRKVLIAGAGGRDFHNFNVVFREDDSYEVVAFTATQIPNIDDRRYPAELAGPLYPDGIPIVPEENLISLIAEKGVEEVILAYSDLPHQYVMDFASKVLAAGVDFKLLGADATMIKSKVPVVSICAIRTGCGKSQTTRAVMERLTKAGKKVVAIRHPMPYGDLVKQKVQRFAKLEDLDTHECTIEECEEYEPHINRGNVVYAGVDYGAILAEAEKEADVIVWDGGNNDLSFYKPDLEIVVVDPHRAGHERTYYPGLANLYRADVVVINKINSAEKEDVDQLRKSIREVNPKATVIDAASVISVDDEESIKGQRVLCVEDGPTLTHGEMTFGVAVLAAKRYGAAEQVDPSGGLHGDYVGVFEKYSHLKQSKLLPAVGYGDKQIADLQATIDAVDYDMALIGTPIDLRRMVKFSKPAQRVYYNLEEIGKPNLDDVLKDKGLLG
jgi:predicted GTPase